MPDRGGVKVEEVRCLVAVGHLLAAGREDSRLHRLYAGEVLDAHQLGVTPIPGLDLDGLTHQHGARVALRLSLADLDHQLGARACLQAEHAIQPAGDDGGRGCLGDGRAVRLLRLDTTQRADCQAEVVRLGLRLVLLGGRALTAAEAAEACGADPQHEVRIPSRGQLRGVWGEQQIQCRVGQGGARHHAVGDEEEAIACGVRQARPAYVLAVGHRLGLGEGDELARDGALVELDELAALAVAVVIDRATAVVAVLVVALGQDELIAETRQDEVRLVGADARVQLDRPVGAYRPDDL